MRQPHVLQLLILEALAFAALRDVASALGPLARAVSLAEPEQCIRVFIDAGPATRDLLLRLYTGQAQSSPADIPALTRWQARLLAHCTAVLCSSPVPAPPEIQTLVRLACRLQHHQCSHSSRR